MKRWLRNNGLSLVLIALFLACGLGMAVSGRSEYNGDQEQHHQPTVNFFPYLGTSHFLEGLAENWESEFLEIGMYVVLTKHLYQKGSAESKDPDRTDASVDEDPRRHQSDPHAPWPVRRGGQWLAWYEHSLSLMFFALFFMTITLHVFAGLGKYQHEEALQGQPLPGLRDYVFGGRFWYESMQNWQSEFLSIACMVLGTKYLRERCSSESKPVATPNGENA